MALVSIITCLPGTSEARKKRGEEPAEVTAPETPPPVAGPLFPAGAPTDVGALPEGLSSVSAQSCNACHFAIHDQWSGSSHASGAAAEAFAAALEGAGESPLCQACHLPLAAQQPRLVADYSGGPLSAAELIPNPSWDATLHGEGVTCAACHVRDGQIISTRAPEHAPHPVAVSDELASPEHCATCHQLTWPGADAPIYDTFGEWSRSRWAEAGIRCQDCHMPPITGPVTAGRFAAHADHRVVADPARAVTVLVSIPADPLVRGQPASATIRVQNTGAGHHFPTGNPFESILLEAEIIDGEGAVAGETLRWRLGREIEPTSPWRTISDTRIAAGDEMQVQADFEIPIKAAAGDGALVVRLRRDGPTTPLPEGSEPHPTPAPFTQQRVQLRVD